MPELPEVHTTVEGLKKTILGKTITDVWSDFHLNTAHGHKQNLKNKKYFQKFKKIVTGAKIKSVERLGKNILIHLNPRPRSDLKTNSKGLTSGYTIIVHMKMTGHLMYGVKDKFVHLVFKLKRAKDLVLSDIRKFASVCLVETKNLNTHERLKDLGLDALKISRKIFAEKIRRKKNLPIKTALMDQSLVAGIGNIYSDEILWASGVHPLSKALKIPKKTLNDILKNTKVILEKSIRLGGDSMSDYINAFGQKGGFQNFHRAYKQTGQKCQKRGCGGIIERIVVGSRSSHFCPKHQKFYK